MGSETVAIEFEKSYLFFFLKLLFEGRMNIGA